MVDIKPGTRKDWEYILENADANFLQTPGYYEACKMAGEKASTLIAYQDGLPASMIAMEHHVQSPLAGLIEVGSRSGGYPLSIRGKHEVEHTLLGNLGEHLAASKARQVRFFHSFQHPFPL